MRDDSELRAALSPLLEVLESGRYLRLVARPSSVHADRAEASVPVAVGWDEVRHDAVLSALAHGPCRIGRITATRLGDTLVLRAPPSGLRRTDDLVRDGWLSGLAGRTLSAAVALGRNVLVVGPHCASVELIAALLTEGKRACVVGDDADAVPAGFSLVETPAEASLLGADRIGAWSLEVPDVVSLCASRGGVLAWLDARRLDRALMRFEVAVEAQRCGPTPLQVLAALDLIVVVNDVGAPRVTEVAEIALVEDGYRPRLLFASGLPPAPNALVPVAAPGFLGELAQAGYAVLADELRHAVGGAPRRETVSRPVAEAPRIVAEPPRMPAAPEWPVVAPVIESPSYAPVVPVSADAPPPGWELDQLGEVPETDGINASADDATMAATYGLGPPPRPAGVRSEPQRGFEEALSRARMREREEAEREADSDGE